MTTTTTIRHSDEIEALRSELAYCRQAQSWSPAATRSSWTGELERVLAAHDAEAAAIAAWQDAEDPDEAEVARTAEAVKTAIDDAHSEAVRLATLVAEDLRARPDRLAEAVADAVSDEGGPDLSDEVRDATADTMVALARRHGVTVDHTTQAGRDGYVVNAHEAVAYAGVRHWLPEASPYVEIDLLTGHVSAHD